MSLKKIGTLKEGRVNTVCVCTDNESDEWHTLWEVKKHKTARMLMDMHGASPFAECGMDGERLCILLAYEEPRPLGRFYQGSLYTWEERRRIYENIVQACVNADVPYPLLYLLLGERCINIRQDGSMYFTYYILLDDLDTDKAEKDCAGLAAGLLAELMELHGRKEERSCLALIRKKRKRNAYNSFTELAHDIKLIDGRKRMSLIWGRIPYPEQSTKDKLFRILLLLTAVFLAAAAILVVSQLMFGDIPLLRAFSAAVGKIGTESLLK